MDIGALQATLRRTAAELLQFAEQAGIALGDETGEKTHVLIDWENVQPAEDDCRRLVPEATDVWLFHGPNQRNAAARYPSFGQRATEVRIARTGKNALDFHLSFYIGYIASRQPQARFVVLSNDQGYAPMLEHARELGFAASQSGFVRAKPARATARKPAVKRVAAPAPDSGGVAKKTAAKKAAAKRAPSKATATKKTAAGESATPTRATGKKTTAKKTAVKAATKKQAPPVPAADKAPEQTSTRPSARAPRPAGRGKTDEQMLALLKQTPPANRPGKEARLLAYLASRAGGDDAPARARACLDRLFAEGHVALGTNGAVTYRL